MIYKYISQIILIGLFSKILGFCRDVLMTSNYGLTSDTDSYFIAVIICTIFFNLTNSGLISSLMVVSGTLYDQKKQNEYFSNMLIVFFVISIIISVIIYFFAPYFVSFFAYGFSNEKATMSFKLVRLGSVIVVFNFITSIFNAFHQKKKRFVIPSFLGVFLNIPLIIYLLFFDKIYGIQGLMIATILGYFFQSIINVISATGHDFRFIKGTKFFDDNLLLTFKMLLPIFLGSIASFVNTLVDKSMASGLQDGIISGYSVALKFRQLFIGLFILSIITPIYSLLVKKINEQEIIYLIHKGTNLIFFTAIPITTFLIFFNFDIISLVFERGNFTKDNTIIVSNSLLYYSVGIIGVGLTGFFSKIFFSLKKPKTPMIINIMSVFLNIILNLILINRLGYIGLPLATSLSSIFSASLLFYFLFKINFINFRNISSNLIKCLLSSLMSLIIVIIIIKIIEIYVLSIPSFSALIFLPVFIIVYIIFSYLLKIKSSIEILSYLNKLKIN